MDPKVTDPSVEEFRALIVETVSDTMEEFLEDAEALRSGAYMESIERARADHATGNTRTFEQIFGDA